jgi:hypothetical protein
MLLEPIPGEDIHPNATQGLPLNAMMMPCEIYHRISYAHMLTEKRGYSAHTAEGLAERCRVLTLADNLEAGALWS